MLKFSLISCVLLCGSYLGVCAATVDPSQNSNDTPPGQLPRLSASSSLGNSSTSAPEVTPPLEPILTKETSKPPLFEVEGDILECPALKSPGREIPLRYSASLQKEILKGNPVIIAKLESLISGMASGKRKLSKRVINVYFCLQEDGEITVEPAGGRWIR